MKRAPWRVASALALGTVALATAAAVAAPDTRATLSTRDRTAVVRAACKDLGAARVEASRERPGSQRLQVDILCNPHGREGGAPVARQQNCTSVAASWQCETVKTVLQVPLSNDTVLPVIAIDVSSQAAVEAITEASKLIIRPFYRPAIRVLKGECTVRRGVAATRPETTNYRIECGETVVFLSRDCFQGKCRHFIPFALNY